jgi:GTP-binding protein
MGPDYATPTQGFEYLLDMILQEIPPPKVQEGTPQLMITSLDYSAYIGRIAVGRLLRGELKENMPISLVKRDGTIQKMRIKELLTFEGLGKVKVSSVSAGYLCCYRN